MIREVILLAGGASFMAIFLTPAVQTTEIEQPTPAPVRTDAPKPATNIVLDEDTYWEYDNSDRDTLVFGEPMVDADAGAADNGKAMTKRAPRQAAEARGKTNWKQEFPRPLD